MSAAEMIHATLLSLMLGAADGGVPPERAADAPAPVRCAPAAFEWVERGRAAQRQKGEDGAKEAAELYRRALAQDASCADALWELGWSLQIAGDLDGNVEAWDRLKKLAPDYPELAERYEAAVRQRDHARSLESLPAPGKLPAPELQPAPGEPLTLVAVGDVHMGRAWPPDNARLPPNGGANLYDAVKESLQQADITFGNLETVLADSGESQKCGKRSTKCFAFRVPTAFAQNLKDAGFDVMSIANNHAGDFGPKGRKDTMAALDRVGLLHSGPVGDLATWETKGKKIALVAFSTGGDVYRLVDIETARRLIASLSKSHDLIFVSFHGGAEGKGATRVPKGAERFMGENRGDVRAFAHAVVDAGADLVLGHGPHVLRAVEIYRGRLIAYSMGNFSSWETFGLSHPNDLTGIFHITLAPNGVVTGLRVEPVVIEKPGRPIPDPEKRGIAILRKLSQLDFGKPVLDEEGAWQLAPGK